MNKELAEKIRHLDHVITMKEIDIRNIEKALLECKQDETELWWSAYGCLSPVHGWGRNDVKRLLDK